MNDPPQGMYGTNVLLKYLSVAGMDRMHSLLVPVHLMSQEVLYHPEQKISDIYFPDSAVLCMLTIMEDGHSIETAMVGREGASWVSASLGCPTMPCQTMVAVGGTARKIKARFVEEEIRQNGAFHDLLSEYAHSLLISSLRTGACNALHSVIQRCSRWMLMTLDRTHQTQFLITQEFLASLLGCNRPVLTGILGEMERSGSIAMTRGMIEVKDRASLERTSCECYRVIRRNSEMQEDRQRMVLARRTGLPETSFTGLNRG